MTAPTIRPIAGRLMVDYAPRRSPTRAERYVAKQRRAAARILAGQRAPARASAEDRRAAKRNRREWRRAIDAERERLAAEIRLRDRLIAESAIVRGEPSGDPVGVTSDAVPLTKPRRNTPISALALMTAAVKRGVLRRSTPKGRAA